MSDSEQQHPNEFDEPAGGWARFPAKAERVGGFAVVVAFLIKDESYRAVNGELESYSNWPATLGGAIALICAVVVLTLLKKTAPFDKNRRIAATLALLICGGVHIARGQGAFFEVPEQGSGLRSITEIESSQAPPSSGPTIADRGNEVDGAIKACVADATACARAVNLARAFCDDEPKEGCDELAILLIDHGEQGVDPDYAGAFVAAQKGCDAGGMMACTNLGVLYFEGKGVGVDVDKAVELTARACEAETGLACKNLGFVYEDRLQDFTKARAAYRKGCDLGNGVGCRALANLLVGDRGGPINKSGAVVTGRQGCAAGDARSCNIAGHLLAEGDGVVQDELGALELFQQSCRFELGSGCTNLGVFLKFGRATSANPAGAFTNFERGCNLGDGGGCYRAGDALWRGDGVALDRERAAKAFGRACELGAQEGCTLPVE